MKPRPVAVMWADQCHVSPGDWVPVADAVTATACPVLTVGILLAKTPDVLVLAQSVSDGNATGVFVIQRNAVKKVRKL